MTPIHCQECGRANGASAKRCIWCGLPIVNRASPEVFAPTRIEIDYLDGIERLDDSATVRMVIGREGIDVSETVPGSRTFKIPASSIIDATVVDGSTIVEGQYVRSPWWWLALGPFAVFVRGKKTPDIKNHDYLLTIRYKQGSETRTAVFHREDRAGLPVVEGLARIVKTLVRLQAESSND
ncbi:MAG TPA: hypothetical protein VNS63_13640 [Blastocatellia bacterium]|nr:hypothetical protein [Blastocatellia bacterium]